MPKAKTPKEEEIPANPTESIQYVAPATEFPFVYANNAVMSYSELDGSLIFGEVVGKDGEKSIVVPKVKVVMATPFLHKLRDLLVRQLGPAETN